VSGSVGCIQASRLKSRVLSIHSTGLWKKESSFTRFDRLFLGGFDRVVALAGMHRKHLVESERIDPSKITVINNGVDTGRFTPASPGQKASAREILGIPGESFVVTIVAALRPEKNHMMLLEAAALLRKKGEGRFVFLVAGSGTEEEILKRKSSLLGLDDTVRFLGERNDVEMILRASDASVLCSFPVVETFPLAVLEAMATGLPVVATDVGSVPEIIDDGIDGMIIESGDVAGLLKALEELEENRRRSSQIGVRARAKVEEGFSVSGMVDSYASLFDEMRGMEKR